MAVTWEARRLRHERAMDRRFIEEQRRLAQAIVPLLLRAATARNDAGDPIIPTTRRARADLKAAIWSQVLKPYFIGRGDDPFDDIEPRSPFALLIRQGVEGSLRLVAQRQAALVNSIVRDETVVQWLTGPRPPALGRAAEMQHPARARGRILEQVQFPAAPLLPPRPSRAAGPSSVPVRARGLYDPFHTYVDSNGYRLSDRIWQAAISERSRIDALLDYHIGRSTSAVEIARELEPFLAPGNTQRTIRPYGASGSYAARRLARTEISAAAGRGTVNAAIANPFVAGVQWRLSQAHRKVDICDEHARGGPNQDGIYPPHQVPRYPAHPHELCHLVPVAAGNVADLVRDLRREIDAARRNLLDAVGGDHARALQGILNPNYLADALLRGTLREAVEGAVRQATLLPPAAIPAAVAVQGNATRPTPPPVSEALTGIPQRGTMAEPIREALAAIDSVHGDGQLEKLPLQVTSNDITLGSYVHNGRTGAGIELRISRAGDRPLTTLAHEVGHWIDQQQLNVGLPRTPGSPLSTSDAARAYRKALADSRAARRLADMHRNKGRWYDLDGDRIFVDRRYVEYLAHDSEFWARAYAQYIAERSGNARMLAEIAAMRQGVYPLAWDPDDFEPIAAAIDALLGEKGWLP